MKIMRNFIVCYFLQPQCPESTSSLGCPLSRTWGPPMAPPWMHSWRRLYPYESLMRQGMTLNCPWVNISLSLPSTWPLWLLELWMNPRSENQSCPPCTLQATHACIMVDPSQQWMTAVIPTPCEKHPGRSGCWRLPVMHPRAMWIGGLQEKAGTAAELCCCTRDAQVDFAQERVE